MTVLSHVICTKCFALYEAKLEKYISIVIIIMLFFFVVVELHLNVATINLLCCQAVDCIDAMALSSCFLKLQQAAVY